MSKIDYNTPVFFKYSKGSTHVFLGFMSNFSKVSLSTNHTILVSNPVEVFPVCPKMSSCSEWSPNFNESKKFGHVSDLGTGTVPDTKNTYIFSDSPSFQAIHVCRLGVEQDWNQKLNRMCKCGISWKFWQNYKEEKK